MHEIHQSVVVPYTAEQMFNLVNDVERYPAFLPWCYAAAVLSSKPGVLRARVSVRKAKFDYSFTTDNYLTSPNRLEMRLVDGPFKRFGGAWRFDASALGCRVSLDLEYEFLNRLSSLALAPIFKSIAGSLVVSFRNRADQLYGATPADSD